MSEKDTFLNPYNFIPFPEKRWKHYEDEDIHTGVITYTVTAKSPLLIPNTSSEHAFAIKAVDEQGRALDHRSCDFYSYAELEEGKDYSRIFASPVIPGSEQRGMVRGIYETLTGSCMGVLNADTYPVKRSGEVFKAALIRRQAGRDGRLALVEAQDCIYRESVNFKDRLFLRTDKEEGADFWTYDYYTREGKAYPYRARLKGRKYYWHQPDKRLPADIPRTELNKTVRPVKSGVTFEAKLYFDRVSARQPDQLLWILNGGNADEQPDQGPVAYELGGGKPLGLGSVELKVKEVFHRRFVREEGGIRYLNEPETDLKIPRYQEAGFLPECREDFLTICALHAAQGKNVTYPIVPEQHGKPMEEGFKWFVRNHSGYDYKKQKKVGMPNARIQMRTLCALPRIQGVKTLPEEPALSGGSGDAHDRSRTQPGSAPAFGKVTGFNKNNTAAYILLDNGKRASVHFKEITFAQDQYGKVDQTLPQIGRAHV